MKKAAWLAAVLAFALVACPAPGPVTPPPPPPPPPGPPPAPPAPPPPTGTDLLINEVGSTRFTNNITWFEVYNPTSSAINLSGYQLKGTGVPAAGGTFTPTTWALPNYPLAAGAYVVIGGKVSEDVFNTDKSVYVVNNPDNVVPFWTADGFVELTKAGATVDFVRFGASNATPTTASGWDNSSAPALPFTDQDFGKSIVRAPGADTNSAADWSSRDFATPAGPNDVPAGAVDVDNDGIPDSGEVAGGTYNGLNLYAMGARQNQRDLFIEVDNMDSADPGLNPQKEALDKVVAAFAARNIAMHFDAGDAFSATFNPTQHNLGNSVRKVPYALSITLGAGLASNLYAIKAQNMDFARNLIFHYLILGSSQNANGSAGSSGLAETPGNDFFVSFGGWGLNRNNGSSTNQLINYMAATIMHELGHNLNLRHGGNQDTNNKPNYYSIMNYDYQLACLGSPTGSNAGDRYYLRANIKGMTEATILNGPTGTACQIDFSDGSSTPLNENALNENNGLGRGAGFIDWNNNNAIDASVALNINGPTDTTIGTLSDFNDWGNLLLPFARTSQAFNNGVIKLSVKPRLTPVSNDVQPVAKEESPSPEFFRQLRESMARR